jgi:hypothetical protein
MQTTQTQTTDSSNLRYQISNVSTAAASFDGWYMTVHMRVTDAGRTFSTYRVAYAWLGPEEGTTGYAPLSEWCEVDSPAFQDFAYRFCTDEVFRREQLDRQAYLFEQTHEVPPWCFRALMVFHLLVQRERHTLSDQQQAIDAAILGLHRLRGIGYFNRETTAEGITTRHEAAQTTTEQDRQLLHYLLDEGLNEHWIQLLGCLAECSDEQIRGWYHKALEHHSVWPTWQDMATWHHPAQEVFISPEDHAKIVEARKKADERALQLIRETLPKQEALALIEKGELQILSKTANCFYLVKRQPDARIEVYRDGKLVERLCLIFRQLMHGDDVALSKIMMLKHMEEDVLVIANHFTPSAPNA